MAVIREGSRALLRWPKVPWWLPSFPASVIYPKGPKAPSTGPLTLVPTAVDAEGGC